MININCENRNPRKKVALGDADRAVRATLKYLGIGKNIELNVVFVSSQKIRVMNAMYLGINRATDVIAFGLDPAPKRTGKGGHGKDNDKIPALKGFFGDIAISTDKAKVNAAKYNTSFDEEVLRYVIHGVLHLAGYKDKTRADKERMKKAEDELLQKLRKK